MTTIVGQRAKHLENWLIGLIKDGYDYYEYMRDVAAVGTCAHQMIEAMLRKEELVTLNYTQAQINAASVSRRTFEEWNGVAKFKLKEAEVQLVSEEHQYGGTLDLYGTMRRKKTLLDIKTSDSGLYLDNFIQTAAYALLAVENNMPVDWFGVVRVGKSGGPAEVKFVEWGGEISNRLVELFLALRKQYEQVYQLKGDLSLKY